MPSRFSIEFSSSSRRKLKAIASKRNLEVVMRRIMLLESFPYLGRRYDLPGNKESGGASYRILFAGNYGIYYVVYEKAQKVWIEYIEDQRRDPNLRFTD